MKLFSKYPFLIPSSGKVVLAIALFYIIGWIVYPRIVISLMTDWYPVGYPFTIHAKGYCAPTYICVEFRWMALLIDLIFWYALSAFVIHRRVKFLIFCLYFIGLVLAIALFEFLKITLFVFL